MKPAATVIVTAYNRVRDLERVLGGYCRQTHTGFEVIVADDGSAPEVKALLDSCAARAPFLLRHVYQPDEGYRKCRVLNSAIRESASDCIIIADGDCVPHRDFVLAHWEHRAPRTVLCGRRVLLGRELSERLTLQDVRAGRLERLSLDKVIDALLGRSRHWDEAIPVAAPFLRRLIFRREPSLLGSNFSLERSLLEEVNGFNEEFVNYGGEDTELEHRLRLAGARLRWVTHLAIQYHLFHEPRQSAGSNEELIRRTIGEGRAACRAGLRHL